MALLDSVDIIAQLDNIYDYSEYLSKVQGTGLYILEWSIYAQVAQVFLDAKKSFPDMNYREAYGMFAANGILFNHESVFRKDNHVCKKICNEFAKINLGISNSFRFDSK